jgi:hypothetical protein
MPVLREHIVKEYFLGTQKAVLVFKTGPVFRSNPLFLCQRFADPRVFNLKGVDLKREPASFRKSRNAQASKPTTAKVLMTAESSINESRA